MKPNQPKPEPLLDPVEALVHIRAVIEATADELYGTQAEPIIREIRNTVDKALLPRPPKRSVRR